MIKRNSKVRNVSELVVSDIFKTLLGSEDVGEYLKNVFEEADSRSPVLSKERGDGGATILLDGPLSNDMNLVGNPVYGVYFDEVGIKKDVKETVTAVTGTSIGGEDEASDDHFDAEISFPNAIMGSDKEKAERTGDALRDGAFIDLAAEILNTMYNLMQEAAHNEFTVDAEPLAFMLKD